MHATDRNERVVLDLIETVWRQGHVDRLGEFWTNDCVNHAAPLGEDRGIAALRAYHEGFAPFFSGLSDIRIDVQQQVSQFDRVVTQIRLAARHTGLLMGVPATDKMVSLATIRIDRIRDGKIAEHWSVADLAGLMQQLNG